MNTGRPRVGVGVIIENPKGRILIGKRTGSHAQKYSIPGGKLHLGESFEHAVRREVKEETDLDLKDLRVIAVTNNLDTFRQEAIHYVSIILHTRTFSGEPRLMEPDKCEKWLWCNPKDIPEPHFDASKLAIECYLNNVVYCGISD